MSVGIWECALLIGAASLILVAYHFIIHAMREGDISFIAPFRYSSLIVAILFVKAVGFGPFAGVLTLVVYSIGFVAKMLAERIEEIDFGQVEAMRAAGAPYLSTLVYAIFPQIMPRQIGLTIYQLDSNLRASAVVGISRDPRPAPMIIARLVI